MSHTFFFFFSLVKKKKGSPNFLDTQLCGSYSVCSRNFFLFSFYFLKKKINHIVLISSRFSCTACHSPLSSVWSLSSSAPWKPSASWQKCTSAHTRPYSLQKGPKHLDLLLFFSPPAAPRWHGKAQDWVCVAETTAFYRLADKNDWMANASSLTESCMELRSLVAEPLRFLRSLRRRGEKDSDNKKCVGAALSITVLRVILTFYTISPGIFCQPLITQNNVQCNNNMYW